MSEPVEFQGIIEFQNKKQKPRLKHIYIYSNKNIYISYPHIVYRKRHKERLQDASCEQIQPSHMSRTHERETQVKVMIRSGVACMSRVAFSADVSGNRDMDNLANEANYQPMGSLHPIRGSHPHI